MRLRFLHKWLFWTPLAVLLLPLPSASSDVPPADELPLEAEVVLTDPFALVPATNSVGRGQIVHGRFRSPSGRLPLLVTAVGACLVLDNSTTQPTWQQRCTGVAPRPPHGRGLRRDHPAARWRLRRIGSALYVLNANGTIKSSHGLTGQAWNGTDGYTGAGAGVVHATRGRRGWRVGGGTGGRQHGGRMAGGGHRLLHLRGLEPVAAWDAAARTPSRPGRLSRAGRIRTRTAGP
jgi:hypothetical protein